MSKTLFMAAVLATTSMGSSYAVADTGARKIDIVKVNQVIENAKNAVLPEFSEWIPSASLAVDPVTFDLEKASLNAVLDATLNKSQWSARPSQFQLDLASRRKDIDGRPTLQIAVGGTLRTQVYEFAIYLANKALASIGQPQGEETVIEEISRAYLTDIVNANNFDFMVQRTVALYHEVMDSPEEAYGELKDLISDSTVSVVGDALNIAIKPVDFFNVKLSALIVVSDSQVSATLNFLDEDDYLGRQYDDWKDAIAEQLLEIQSNTKEIQGVIKNAARDFFSMAIQIVKGEEI